jgi:hypothetical protein
MLHNRSKNQQKQDGVYTSEIDLLLQRVYCYDEFTVLMGLFCYNAQAGIRILEWESVMYGPSQGWPSSSMYVIGPQMGWHIPGLSGFCGFCLSRI